MPRLIFLCGIMLGIATGCAGPTGRLEVTPLESRVDVVAGRTLVMPVELAGPIDLTGPLDVRLDDGRRPGGGLFWISVAPDPAHDPRAWLAPAGLWFATPASASSRPSAAGVWAVVVDLPADAVGQGLWLRDQRVALNWIGDGSEPMPTSASAASSSWDVLAPERQSPTRRWRWRLLSGGEARADVPRAFEDRVLEALAAQREGRWAFGLSRLARDDPTLGAELVRCLGLTVDFEGIAAPAWPADERELENLLGDLLSPSLDAPRRAARVRAWLAARPEAVAWAADDAGGAPAARSVTIGIANLLGDAVLAGAAPDDGSLPDDLVPLGPSIMAMLSVAVPGAATSASAPPALPIRVRAGAWEHVLGVRPTPQPARPPGLVIGPLLRDWTMQTWLAGSPTPAAGDDQRAALLLMRDGGRWAVYIEAAGDPAREDVVRVWLGPTGASSAVLRVSSDGFVVDEVARGPESRDPSRTPVARLADGRWNCKIAVPARCIEPDGTLRIGVERVDSAGRRSAWPRPMLPWQVEPGRLAVDTGQWGGLGESR